MSAHTDPRGDMRLAPADDLTPDEQELIQQVIARRGPLNGPFAVLRRTPRLCDRVDLLASYCLNDGLLPLRLSELTLLIAARHFDAQHSWLAHVGKAIAAGVDPGALSRLAAREDPQFGRADERLLHRFAAELLDTHAVSAKTYADARAQFGDDALVELVTALGTFTTLAMLLNAFEVDLPAGAQPPFPDLTQEQNR